MNPRAVCLLATALLTVAPTPSSAAPLLDQSYVADPVIWAAPVNQSNTLGQTFVAGRTGRLEAIELQIGRAAVWDRFENLYLEVRTVTGGRPDLGVASILASVEMDWSEVPPYAVEDTAPLFTRVDVSGAALYVGAGDALAIVLRSPESAYFRFYNWSASDFAVDRGYEAGSLFQLYPGLAWDTDRDAGFRTFISPVPEPGLILLWGGAVCAWALRRRHSRG